MIDSYHKRAIEISWYLKRLRKMPPGEIPYRLNQVLRKKIDKYFPPDISFNSQNIDSKTDIWEYSKNQTNYIQKLKHIGFKINDLIKEADSFVKHEFDIFGIRVDYGRLVDYHLDPKSGKSWPKIFWGDIDYRNPDAIGGIKFAWELNRLHHLPKLAIAYSQTRDQKYHDELFKQIKNWIDVNPYPLGINWISGIEIGIRIVNLFYVIKYLPVEKLSRNHKELLKHFVFIHAQHLYRYPSKYSSCANHAIAEALGLFIAGLCFPSFKNAHKWKSFGKKVIEREVTRQIYPDGSSFEHSVPYLQFVADHFLVYYLICNEYKVTISDQIEKRIRAVCNFIACIVDIKGNVPLIGDDDDGYLLKLWSGEHNNFLSLLSAGSILFDRKDWVHPTATSDSKTALLLGDSTGNRREELEKEKAWPMKTCYFDNAGLGIITHSKNGKEIKFIGNSGPLGLEPMSGHGHADALSFYLSIDGQPFFIDPGTYLYHSGGKWRRYFRSTSAHNTIQVDSRDQAEQLSDFMFGEFYNIRNVRWSDNGERTDWGAEHTGYLRLTDPVIHRRDVSYIKHEYSFKITDTIKCIEKHDTKLFFHLHPDVKVLSEGENAFCLNANNVSVIFRMDSKLKGHICSGSKEPLLGWYSPSFNQIQKTTSMVFTKEICGDSIFKSEVTVL